jgi:hypothetical protein
MGSADQKQFTDAVTKAKAARHIDFMGDQSATGEQWFTGLKRIWLCPLTNVFCSLALVLAAIPTLGSDSKAPPLVLEPNKYSFTFGVPKDWDFSFDQAHKHGATLVFFPEGGGFDPSTTIVYVTDLCRGNCAGTLTKAIDATLTNAKHNSPKLKVAILDPLKTGEGGEAQVRVLTGESDPRQAKEALAFIEHNEAIILVVLTTKDATNWDTDYKVLREIVSGHKFFNCSSPGLSKPCQ